MRKLFKNKKVLITVGPTREYLDSVRFLSNASSGRMGLALADRFRSLGAEVVAVCGPGVATLSGIECRRAVSAEDMLRAVRKAFRGADVFVACAAVADYRPAAVHPRKRRKIGRAWSVRLVPTPDILSSVARTKTRQFCVGFSLQDSGGKSGIIEAGRKMSEKNCDLMVLNTLDSMESDSIRPTLLFPRKAPLPLGKISKAVFASRLCQIIAQNLPS